MLELVPRAAPARQARATLASLCEAAGGDLLAVVVAPRGLDVPVTAVGIHEPIPGGVILAPCAAGTDELLQTAQGAAAVVVKRRRPLRRWLLDAFTDAGVALLAAPPDVPWGDLHVVLLAALAAGEKPPADSLAGLADATAEMAGGPVTIEDLHGRVLTFSQGGQDIDAGRAATVLGRRVPERWMRELRRSGVLDRLARSGEVMRVELPGLAPRRAVAIRSAGTTLGVIWLAGDAFPEADAVLDGAALAAAVQLARRHACEDLDRRTRTGMLRMLLEGEGTPASLLGGLGLPGGGDLAVVAVRGTGDLERLADLLCAHLRSDRFAVAGGVLDDRVYAIAAPARERALRRAVGDWLTRAGAEVYAGLGEPVPAAGLPAARRAADRCLALAERPNELVAYDAVHGRALLAAVAALLDADGRVSPALRALGAYDADRGTDYIETLRAFLEVHGDCARTAARLGIHVNTMRYRMRRLSEIAGLDLDDPEARLAVALELHALGQRRAAPGVTSPIS